MSTARISTGCNSILSGWRPAKKQLFESFNGRLRDECLNVEVLFALLDVRDMLERWRQDYNQVRPHSASRANCVPGVMGKETAVPAS